MNLPTSSSVPARLSGISRQRRRGDEYDRRRELQAGGNRLDYTTPALFRERVTDQLGHASRRSSSPAALSLPGGTRSSANPHSDHACEWIL